MEELDNKTKINTPTISKISIFILFLLLACFLPFIVSWILGEIVTIFTTENIIGVLALIFSRALALLQLNGMLLGIPLSLIGLVFAIIAFRKEKHYRYRKLIFIASISFFLYNFSNLIRMF